MTPLPPIEHAARVEATRRFLAETAPDVDACLFTDLFDVRWLTGFSGSNGWAVLRAQDLVVGTDARYGERARAETASSQARVVSESRRDRLHEQLVTALSGARTVALDPTSSSHAAWTALSADLPLRELSSPARAGRQVKDAAEIARIERAARAADLALAEVEPLIIGAADDPVTEHQVRTELEYRMRLHGADDRSYDTIVAAGADHAARPHHEAGHRPIVDGDTVIVDVGGLVDGYHSDMTRCWVIGDPTPQQRDVLELVAASHRAGLDAVRDGLRAADLDAACRDVVVEAGYGDWYLHGTGHGVGLEIHEPPFHSPVSEEVIRTGQVLTVEPGLYRGGFGGFRIEDLVVVTPEGSRVVTHSPQRSLTPKD